MAATVSVPLPVFLLMMCFVRCASYSLLVGLCISSDAVHDKSSFMNLVNLPLEIFVAQTDEV